MTTLTPSNGTIRLTPPASGPAIKIAAPTGRPIRVISPDTSIRVINPTTAGPAVVVPVTGPPGHDGAPGAPGTPGTEPEDLPDLTLIFENGLI